MKPRRISVALAGLAFSAAVGAALWPHARHAGALLAAQDDPAELADLQLGSALRTDRGLIGQNIDAALAAGDADLASSFVSLAQDKHIAVDDERTRHVADAVAEESSAAHVAKRFATGLVTGTADDVASLSGTVAGDLFVFGDIRDAVREGKHLAMGEQTDRLVLGLAAAGLAVTAATYVSAGGAAPVRAGLTLVKDARKVGRLGEGLAEWAGRSAREVVDAPALEQAVASGSVLRPGETATAIKAAFRAEKAGGLVRLAKDVGRITEKAGTRGALDSLKVAEGPKDVARAARLAEAEGAQDPRDPEAVRPRRAIAARRRVQSQFLAVRRRDDDIRLRGVLEGYHGTDHPGLARSPQGAAVAPAAGGGCGSGTDGGRGLQLMSSRPRLHVSPTSRIIADAELSQRRS